MKRLLSLIFPPVCPYCRKPINWKYSECELCRRALLGRCYYRNIFDNTDCYAPFPYSGPARSALHDFKFRNHFNNADSFSGAMYYILDTLKIKADVVTCVPLHPASKRMRGFNQSEILARKIAGMMKIPYKGLLLKTRKNLVQHELSAEQRRENVIGVYKTQKTNNIEGRHIVLVDDVCTSGSTLEECARALKNSGAASVCCIVVTMVDDRKEIRLF